VEERLAGSWLSLKDQPRIARIPRIEHELFVIIRAIRVIRVPAPSVFSTRLNCTLTVGGFDEAGWESRGRPQPAPERV